LVVVCCRPFSVVVEKSGPNPRIEMMFARPLFRCAATPGSRAIDSPMLLSGSLPMSSAVTDSTTVSEFFFFAVALRRAARKPVTTIAFGLALG
jgi:hypothetical protein